LTARDPLPRWAPAAAFVLLAALYPWTLGRPSFWLDEAWEANYYAGFTAAPWYNRPMLYMAHSRAMASVFGPSEFALRLLPCLAALGAVALTYRLARRSLSRTWSLLAASLLAFGPPLLREAHQLKHYALDALFTAGIVLAFLRWRESRTSRRLLVYVGVCLLSFGFSFGSIFIVAALAAVDAWGSRFSRHELMRTAGVHAGIATAFALVFFAFHRDGGRDPLLVAYFTNEYLPWRTPQRVPVWLARGVAVVCAKQTGASSGLAALALAAAGWWSARRSEASFVTACLAAALALNAAASAPALYPFGVERLSIYLAPWTAIVVAHGVLFVRDRVPLGAVAAIAIAALLFAPSAGVQAAHLLRPPLREEIRAFVHRIGRESTDGETLFVAEDALPAFQFYWQRNGKTYPPSNLVLCARLRQEPGRHRDEVERLAEARRPVWSLLTHMPDTESDTIARLMAERFDHTLASSAGDARLDRWSPR